MTREQRRRTHLMQLQQDDIVHLSMVEAPVLNIDQFCTEHQPNSQENQGTFARKVTKPQRRK